MEITVNGKMAALEGALCLADFLAARGFSQGKILIEYNGEILPAAAWENIVLRPGDRMEIVTFVGGG